MDTRTLAAVRQSLTGAASRRGLLSGLAGGALASGIFAHEDDAAAKKRKKNRKNKKKRKPTNAQTIIAATCNGSSFRINTTGDQRLAQPFVAQVSGPLVRVALQLDQRATDGAGDYILRLGPVDDASVPTNQVLAESTVAGASVPDGPSTVDFDFADPFSLKAGVEYALVLARPGSEQFAWAGDLGDRCAGRLFFSTNQTGNFADFDPAVEGRFTAFVRS